MKEISLIRLDWNNWNGFIFHILKIELGCFEGDFIGLNFSKNHFNFSLLFIYFEVKSPLN